MKHLIKFTALVLTAAMLCVLFTSCADTNAPETTAPETTLPVTTSPETTVPAATSPDTTVPETTAPQTTAPSTTAPVTTAPAQTEEEPGKKVVKYGCPFGESFRATDINGKVITAEDFKNAKVVMLNFWGTFCSPCLNEMPGIGKLAAKYRDQGVLVVGIAIDVNGNSNLTKAQGQIVSTGADYTHFAASAAGISAIEGKYWRSNAVPVTVFLDADGNEYYRTVGSKNALTWEAYINQVLYEIEYED